MSRDLIKIHDTIREACLRRPELKYDSWPNLKYDKEYYKDLCDVVFAPFQGFCYVASYAFCHVVPEASPYTYDRYHFWAQIGDDIWDLTKDQFDEPYEYHKGRKLPRKSKPTKRVLELLKESKLI